MIKKDKEEHFIWVKGKNLPRRLNISLNSKHLCSKCKGVHFHKRNFSSAQNTECTSHNNSERFQHSILINGQIMEIQTKQRHRETNRSYGPNEFNRYL